MKDQRSLVEKTESGFAIALPLIRFRESYLNVVGHS